MFDAPSVLETGILYRHDNIEKLSELPDCSIDLIYLDPPFFSKRFYEVIWGDEAEVRSFEDRWEGGIQHYISWMRERVVEMYRVLHPNGSLYLHCDPSASHYLKVMLDEIFGMSRFQNEISWKRSAAKNDAKRYGRTHDVIFFYSKGSQFRWNIQYGPFEPDYVEANYRYVEEGTGRLYRLSDLTANKPGGDVDYEWHGMSPYKGRHWAFSRDNMDKFLADGRIVFRRTGMPVYKRYLDEMPGVPLQESGPTFGSRRGPRSALAIPPKSRRRSWSASSVPAATRGTSSSTPSVAVVRRSPWRSGFGDVG